MLSIFNLCPKSNYQNELCAIFTGIECPTFRIALFPRNVQNHEYHPACIPIALQISALAYGGVGVFGKGFGSMDAVIEPTWTYSRRPLTGTPDAEI
ncbi:hypothetical protein EQU24_14290 [Methylotuvimicrobium buryatense]|uniref:Uncharacterized protein n=1 Tax=Methylotuvimicrobium buryatense TaxID=95641 RepID=A0A4P9URZ9_METBY|nr:hypothetical protein EQU24_14290 [Methylotuvimicrobium buryatense]